MLTEQQQYNRFITACQHFSRYIASLSPERRDAFVDSLAEAAAIA